MLGAQNPLADNLLFPRERVLFWVFQVCDSLEVSVRSVEVFMFIFDAYWQHFQKDIQRQDIQMIAMSALAFVIQEIDHVSLSFESISEMCKYSHTAEMFSQQMANLKQCFEMSSQIITPSVLLKQIDANFDENDFKFAIMFFYQMNDKGTIQNTVDILYVTLQFIRTSSLMVDIDYDHIDSITELIIPFLKTSKSELDTVVEDINQFVEINDSKSEECDVEFDGTPNLEGGGGEEEEELESPLLPKSNFIILKSNQIQQQTTQCEDEKSDYDKMELDELIQKTKGFESGVFSSSPHLNEIDYKIDNSNLSINHRSNSNNTSNGTSAGNSGFEAKFMKPFLFPLSTDNNLDSLNTSLVQDLPQQPQFITNSKQKSIQSNNCVSFQQFPTNITLDDEVQ